MFWDFMFSEPRFIKEDRWLVKQVTFPGHATTTTRVFYEAVYHVLFEADCVHYIYGTGSYWKDNIGKASFTIAGTEKGGTKHLFIKLPRQNVSPISTSENVVTYELRNLEPEPDDHLTVTIPR
jgi:hypothetical protein